MVEKQLKYNPTNPESIENYAIQLQGKTFMDVFLESEYGSNNNILDAYANRLRKGGLGNFLEEIYFGYKANSNQDADFPEAGVELKVTPYEINQKGKLHAGERLVLTMISYTESIESEFYSSHAWKKMRSLLLIYYHRNKQLNNNLLYKIGYVKLFTPPDADLEIIKRDYAYIIKMIQAGRAHELSEGDTMYLGACTKGKNAEKSTVPQYYGNHELARKRAFCFKISYMTFVLNHYIVGDYSENAILKDASELRNQTFEEIIEKMIGKYMGMSDKELCEKFNREYNNNKAQWNDLAYKMLGVRDENADEFQKANIKVKTIRIEENGNIKENMSFSPFKFMDLVNEEFDDSTLHNYFEETRFFFLIWKQDGDVYRVAGCMLWNMPKKDLEVTVRDEWEKYKHVIQYGLRFEKHVDSNGKVSFSNNLPKKSETKIIHVRPHAAKAAYRFKNGEEYGDIELNANVLPNGEYMTTQSFWLNNDYILQQIKKYF